MCLSVRLNLLQRIKCRLGLHPKTPNDIEVYVFRIIDDGVIYSPFGYYDKIDGFKDTIPMTSWELNKIQSASERKHNIINNEAGIGWIHSCSSINKLLEYISNAGVSYNIKMIADNKLHIYKAIIPAKSYYYYGWLLLSGVCTGYVSSHLILKEDITQDYRTELDRIVKLK